MSQLLEEIESLRGSMKTLNDFFFDHPELGNEEFLAHGKLTDLLESEGFTNRISCCVPCARRRTENWTSLRI